MYAKVCPLCNTKFYSAKKESCMFHGNCEHKKELGKDTKRKQFRTSTPVSEIEQITSSFSDSVSDFFYQSWKNGLHCNSKSQVKFNETLNRHYIGIQPVPYPTQIIYVNAMIWHPIFSASGICSQPVGFRSDGTFGLLPVHWPFFV